MIPTCDLHAHSHFSDGSVSPAELASLARKAGLAAVALCDHNTVAGLGEFFSACKKQGVEAVAGIEFSVDYAPRDVPVELHLLALGLEEKNFVPIGKKLEEALREKEKSNLLLMQNLQKVGIALTYEEIRAASRDRQVNRAVIGSHMVKKGYVSSVKEAFDRYLDIKCGHFVPPRRLDVYETLDFIRAQGAISVLAHPLLNLSEEELEVFLPKATAHGLVGMEVYYSKFTPAQREYLAGLCRRHNILPSGGSDFHGENKPGIHLGTGRGDLCVPYGLWQALKVAKPENLL